MKRKAIVALLGAVLATSGCSWWYYSVPSPDDALHLVPWFDAMIVQAAVQPYSRADVPRYTVAGTVPVGSTLGDWEAEWAAGNRTTANLQVNPLAGRPATATGDTLYHTFCGPCHGNAGEGFGLVGAKMAALPLTSDRARAFTDGYIYSYIRYGGPVMPRYGDKIRGLSRWELVNFVRKLQADAAAAAAPPAAGATPAQAAGGPR
jgi:mono/diheme cytochrome c family protein